MPSTDATGALVALVPPPVAARVSNLDRGLTTVLKSESDVGKLTPADNAGLGLHVLYR